MVFLDGVIVKDFQKVDFEESQKQLVDGKVEQISFEKYPGKCTGVDATFIDVPWIRAMHLNGSLLHVHSNFSCMSIHIGYVISIRSI